MLDLRTREDTDDPRLLARLEGASAVYFSGGNPAYLAATLADSEFLDAMLKQLDRGMAYAGCSAGVACLNEKTFDSDTTDLAEVCKPGLGLVPETDFAPHWDMVDTFMPGATEFIVAAVPEGHTFVGLDEDTAMVGDGSSWEVMGKSGIHVRTADGSWSDVSRRRAVRPRADLRQRRSLRVAAMDEMYHEGNRELQDRFDTRRLADRIENLLVHDVFTDRDRGFIESRDMFFLASADEDGKPNVSYKGGDPGFIRVVDEHTLAFPNYNGNGMYLSMGNLLKNPHVGILFMDFEGRDRMRVNGEASVRLRRRAAVLVAGSAVRGPRARAGDLPELPAVRAPLPEGRRHRRSCLARTARRRCRRGSGRTGRSTCCPRATPPSTRRDGGLTLEKAHRRRRPGHAGVPRPRRHGAEGGAADEGGRRHGGAR